MLSLSKTKEYLTAEFHFILFEYAVSIYANEDFGGNEPRWKIR
jgi:hypothetical protein